MEPQETVKEACERSMRAYVGIATTGAEFPIVEVVTDDQIDVLLVAEDIEVRDFITKVAIIYSLKKETVKRITLASGAYYKEAIQDQKTKKIIQTGKKQECVITATMDYTLESYVQCNKLERRKQEILLTEDMAHNALKTDVNVLKDFWTVYTQRRMQSLN